MRRLLLVIFALILGIIFNDSFAHAMTLGQDTRAREAKYIHNIEKREVKEGYERTKGNLKPSGNMTMEEYEMLSIPKDKTREEIPIPKPVKAADVKYIPNPDYKIVRYNNPPGSPEISLSERFKFARQQNAQGIVSPDYSILVYPSIYYYPNSSTTSCDLFVIPLIEGETALNKILKANVMHRIPDPIMSTDKSINDKTAFRTLTPVDFSADGRKLLVKEKIGGSEDGIWLTNAYVYDFDAKTSLNLSALRDAVVYYWKEYKNVDLEDKRWDIYPLGFDVNQPDRVLAYAYAYTGSAPVFLGSWSIGVNGESARLISFDNNLVQASMNGVKIIQDGVVPVNMLKIEEKQAKYEDKLDAKAKKIEEKAKYKELKVDYKETIKQMNEEYSLEKKDYNMQNRIKGTTSTNDAVETYAILKEKQMQKQAEKEAKAKARAEAKEQKRLEKEQQKQDNI